MLGNPPPGPMMDKTTDSNLAFGWAVLYLLPGPCGIESIVHRGRLPPNKAASYGSFPPSRLPLLALPAVISQVNCLHAKLYLKDGF